MELKDKLIKIFRELKDTKLSDDALYASDYVDKGILDSFETIGLITKLEEEFKIKFSSDDLLSNKFKSLKGISELVQKAKKR